MAAQDATLYWLSKRIRNDVFVLYCFTDLGRPTEELRAMVAQRSAGIADLRVRLRELPWDLDYPQWRPCEFIAEQFLEHRLAEPTWLRVLDALGGLLGSGVDATVRPWRVHVFRGIVDAPGPGSGAAVVAVLQLSHALADGQRASQIGRALFSTESTDSATTPPPARAGVASNGVLIGSVTGLLGMPIRLVSTVARGYRAFRARQRLMSLTESGRVPPAGPGFVPSCVNRQVEKRISRREVRMLVFEAEQLRVPDRTVTVVLLTAVSSALSRYTAGRGEPVERLGAQVPMALPEPPTTRGTGPRNNYRSLSIDLFVAEPDLRRRAGKIAAELAARRSRARHPLLSMEDRVTAAIPAVILRRDVERYPIDSVPDSIAGHTVVSSVDRGRADLAFGGGSVRFSSGFPALGAVMHLTHGVHGLGDTIVVSLHADQAVVPDLDEYAQHLRDAIADTIEALTSAGM
ncbi:wax ester/triacylglycerol synthase domain-containing protein [Nocardia sp. CNY236]|uniref:wax ester/triacylglycerol synthase domain-containing protein n=1 Tax=Nocardia sp. CNY236 TaxID=1169152 RepID=UPI00055FBE88|nr:wax ester/triacylglycerol synthase domain-containing protein [Nocardia sp. CNY236]